MRLVFFFIFTLFIVSGCATSNSLSSGVSTPLKSDYSNMYLRGIMNWWEASEPYKLTNTEEDIDMYGLEIELIADGQPYDFKLADNAWKNELNCGTEFGKQEISLNQRKKLYCAGDSANIKFTPQQTGQYKLTLDARNSKSPTLKIEEIN